MTVRGISEFVHFANHIHSAHAEWERPVASVTAEGRRTGGRVRGESETGNRMHKFALLALQ